MLRRSVGLLIAIFLAAAPCTAAAQSDEHVFLDTTVEGWSLRGVTRAVGLPTAQEIGEMYCVVKRRGLWVMLSREGSAQVNVYESTESSFPADYFATMNIAALTIGHQRYEAYAASLSFGNRYSNVTYPPDTEDRYILSVFHGYLAVRTGRNEPWFPVSSILPIMLSHDSMTVDYRVWSKRGDNTKVDKRATVSLKGLSKALVTCQQAMKSPEALKLGTPAN